MGGYFGGVLARAHNEVILVARGEQLKAIQQRGLTVKSHHYGQLQISPQATSDPAEVGPIDLVLFTVKTYHNPEAIPLIQPMVGPDTMVLTLQNGVESYQQLAKVLGPEPVLCGAAYIETGIESPGVIQQKGEVVRIVFGEHTGQKSRRSQKILDTLTGAGIETELSSDVMKALWSKFVFIVTLAGSTTAARTEMYELLEFPEGRELVMAVLREAESVGRALGIALDDDLFHHTMSYLDGYAKDLHASMYTDLLRGKPLELEALNGAVVRLGGDAGLPVPVNQCLYALLKPYVGGAAQHGSNSAGASRVGGDDSGDHPPGLQSGLDSSINR